jgi:hypothetical protein
MIKIYGNHKPKPDDAEVSVAHEHLGISTRRPKQLLRPKPKKSHISGIPVNELGHLMYRMASEEVKEDVLFILRHGCDARFKLL